MLSSLLPDHWREILRDKQSQIDELGLQLQKRADQGERILPDKKFLFRALELKPESV
jgi:uracil DNA glycosylase